MEVNALNNSPKNVTLKKEECEAFLGRRDVLLDYACDSPALKLVTVRTTFHFQIFLPPFAKAFREGFIFFFFLYDTLRKYLSCWVSILSCLQHFQD